MASSANGASLKAALFCILAVVYAVAAGQDLRVEHVRVLSPELTGVLSDARSKSVTDGSRSFRAILPQVISFSCPHDSKCLMARVFI